MDKYIIDEYYYSRDAGQDGNRDGVGVGAEAVNKLDQ